LGASDSPTRALARRFDGSRRARGSLRCARSHRDLAGGWAPRTPRHAPSLAASPARSVRVARSRRSFVGAHHPRRLRPIRHSRRSFPDAMGRSPSSVERQSAAVRRRALLRARSLCGECRSSLATMAAQHRCCRGSGVDRMTRPRCRSPLAPEFGRRTGHLQETPAAPF